MGTDRRIEVNTLRRLHTDGRTLEINKAKKKILNPIEPIEVRNKKQAGESE